jgi:hypothetical protein
MLISRPLSLLEMTILYMLQRACNNNMYFLLRKFSFLLQIFSESFIKTRLGLSNNSYKPITNTAWVPARFCKLQKGCTRLVAASDKVYQLLAHGRCFSPDTLASSITKNCI